MSTPDRSAPAREIDWYCGGDVGSSRIERHWICARVAGNRRGRCDVVADDQPRRSVGNGAVVETLNRLSPLDERLESRHHVGTQSLDLCRRCRRGHAVLHGRHHHEVPAGGETCEPVFAAIVGLRRQRRGMVVHAADADLHHRTDEGADDRFARLVDHRASDRARLLHLEVGAADPLPVGERDAAPSGHARQLSVPRGDVAGFGPVDEIQIRCGKLIEDESSANVSDLLADAAGRTLSRHSEIDDDACEGLTRVAVDDDAADRAGVSRRLRG